MNEWNDFLDLVVLLKTMSGFKNVLGYNHMNFYGHPTSIVSWEKRSVSDCITFNSVTFRPYLRAQDAL